MGRYKLAVGTIGASKRVIELSASYANQRQQFKTPISKFSLIGEKSPTCQSNFMRWKALFIVRSGCLKTNGHLERRRAKDGRQVAKSIAEYAIECSLNKVFGSETLDYIVDEGVQIHGGYGFMQEYEVERAYRDSRINRILKAQTKSTGSSSRAPT
ncbi:acyl-CoA dehydrogenase family protein [Bacillus licheniformis]|nr:acyl-CoA dehydrogenase family protein [Bacillus licheniformis]